MKTKEQIKKEVLEQCFQSCCDDSGYLENLIEWAYRDYSDQDYLDEFMTMGLHEKDK